MLLVPNLSDEQRLLLDATDRMLEATCPMSTVRSFANGEHLQDDETRIRAAELGWFGFLVAERHGGGSVSDNGVVDAALVAAWRGNRLQPGPFVPTNVVAFALDSSASPDHVAVLRRLVSGDAAAAWAVDGFDRRLAPQLEVVDDGSAVTVSGTLSAVQDAENSDVLLVTLLRGPQRRQYLVPRDTDGVHIRPAHGLDLTRKFAEVQFDHVELPAGSAVRGPEGFDALVARQVDIAAVLSAADAVGAMERDFDLALEYAKSRIAFGRPIGSFQAIKHQLANCSLWLEMSKAAVTGAARAVGIGAPEASTIASAAKAYVGERGIELTQSCFQVFGGIGYTWEHDHHLVMRRLGVEAQLYGSPAWHRTRILRLGGLNEGSADLA